MLVIHNAVHAVQPCLTASLAHPAPIALPVILATLSIQLLFYVLLNPVKSAIAILAMLPITPSVLFAILDILFHRQILRVKSYVETGSCLLELNSVMMAIPSVEMDAALLARLKLASPVILSTSMRHLPTLTVSTQAQSPSQRYGLGNSKDQTPSNFNSNFNRPSNNGPR